MIIIAEHQKIELNKLAEFNLDRLKEHINYNTSSFDASKINLIRYEYDPNLKKDGFYSYFRIGAEWLDPDDQTKALIVLPKISQIDYIEMFMTCLRSSAPEDDFSAIYDIDIGSKPIRSKVLNSILSPLLIVQFLLIVKQISERGLRKGYVSREGNLNKVKGRIDFRKNEILNIRNGHKERIYCRYEEFSVDTLENRYLKRGLRITSNMISMMSAHRSYDSLNALCNQCLNAFGQVSDTFEELHSLNRNNRLFHEYSDALRIAQMIIRKEEMSLSSRNQYSFDFVPVFRIDMSLLFEHYVLAKLREKYGIKKVIYQQKGNNAFYPDFLINEPSQKIIADAKYTELYTDGVINGDYIKQLSGYARDIQILKALKIDCSNPDRVPIVPCSLIYPSQKEDPETNINLMDKPNKNTIKFFTTTIKIPTLSHD
ncbi:MAG: McrC family protein [Muribaculaceae bacterium]|nr:McrC family protein [Muribaculaceae bacterium]